jgi:hypothetical protein
MRYIDQCYNFNIKKDKQFSSEKITKVNEYRNSFIILFGHCDFFNIARLLFVRNDTFSYQSYVQLKFLNF